MDFGTVLHVLYTGIVLLLMVSILVAAHEFGHYLFARLFGMGVEEFAIGMGKPRLKVWMRKTYSVDPIPGPAGQESNQFTEEERYAYLTDGSTALQPEPVEQPSPSQVKLSLQETTDFTIRPWPVGGFVRIKGMVPEEDGSETKVPGGFYSKAPWKRFIVLLAGPVFSVVAGVIILTGVYSVRGLDGPDPRPVLGGLSEDGAAYQAGLREKDLVTKVDGKPVAKFYDMILGIVDKSGQPVEFEYVRDGKTLTATVTPVERDGPILGPDLETTQPARKAGRIGVAPDISLVKLSFGAAFAEAVRAPVKVVTRLISLIPRPKELKENVGGPISIARATSAAVQMGPGFIILLSGWLSISVGIFNLLPIPPLDGGQMLVAIAEALRRGRRLSFQVQGTVAAIGFSLVLVFFVTVMYIDIGRLISPKEPAKAIPKEQKLEEAK